MSGPPASGDPDRPALDAEAAGPVRGSVRRAYVLSGRVQGVGFRWWTARRAEASELRGTVQNLPDGRVEVHVEGPIDRVAAFEEGLREGPRAARVDSIERIEPTDRLPAGFAIKG